MGQLAAGAGALTFVLALIWLSQAVLRRAGRFGAGGQAGAAGTRRLAIVQSLALDPRRRLQLVRCDGRHLLLLTGGTQDVVVGFLPDPRAPEDAAP